MLLFVDMFEIDFTVPTHDFEVLGSAPMHCLRWFVVLHVCAAWVLNVVPTLAVHSL